MQLVVAVGFLDGGKNANYCMYCDCVGTERAALRAALRDLCISNGDWCSNNSWSGGVDDYCTTSNEDKWTGVSCNSSRVSGM